MEKKYRVYQDEKGIFFIAEDMGKVFLKKIKGKLLGKDYTLDEAIAMRKLLGEGNDIDR
jgi:hypothetical protein